MPDRRFVAACLLASISAAPTALAEPVKARRVDDFIDSMGANRQTAATWELLADVGMRHMRDAAIGYGVDNVNNFFRSQGTYSLLALTGEYNRTPEGMYDWILKYNRDAVTMIEGMNEVDNAYIPTAYNYTYNGQPAGYPSVKASQDVLYGLLKTDPAWKDAPLANFTLILGWAKAAPFYSYDVVNEHSYGGRDRPEATDLKGRWLNEALKINPPDRPQGPMIVTETGYTTDFTAREVPEIAQAKYIPRLFASYFQRGVYRTYLFCLGTHENYGLIRNDATRSKKPSYFALKNFTATLNESAWDTADLRWELPNGALPTSYQPGWLDYTATGGTNLTHLLLQRSDGDFYLVIWQALRVTDPNSSDTMNVITNAPATVTLGFRTAVDPSAQIWTQQDDGSYAATPVSVSGVAGSQTASLTVTDAVSIVRIRPAGGLAATQTAPAFGRTIAALNVGSASGSGKFAGETARTAYTFTDTSPVIPGGPVTWAGPVSTAGVTDPAPQNVYTSAREGFSIFNLYGLVPHAQHRVRLHFAENPAKVNGAGQRKFDVRINGELVLDDFDIYAAAGGSNRAVVREFWAYPNLNGVMVVQLFNDSAGSAMINGIQVLVEGAENERYLTALPADAEVRREDGTNVKYVSTGTADRVLAGTYSNTDRNAVFPFRLPNLGPSATFTGASASIAGVENAIGLRDWSLDLYGLPARSDAAPLGADYFNGTIDTAAGVARVQDDFVPRNTSGTPVLKTSSAGGSALASYLNAQYAGGAGAGKYVFLRLSPDAAGTNLPNDRIFKLATAEYGTILHKPTIGYTVSAVTAKPVARYAFDGSATDTGGVNHGTVTGAVFGSDARFGTGSLGFDGGGDYVTLPSGILGSSAGSFAGWVKTAQNADGMILYGANTTVGDGFGSQGELHLNMSPGGKVLFFIEGGAAPDVVLSSTTAINDNAWHHVAATWDVNGEARLYIDGEPEASIVHDASSFTCTGRVRLGAPNDARRYYAGRLDEVTLHSAALSPDQVAELAAGAAPGS